MAISLHQSAADSESCLAIEHPSLEKKGADEVDAGAEKPRQDAGFLALLKVGLRSQLGKMELLPTEVLGGRPRIVQQVSFQEGGLWRPLVNKPLVDEAFPLGKSFSPKAHLGVGIKAAPLDPSAAIVVETVHRKHLVVGNVTVPQHLDGLRQRLRQHLVAIDGEDEVVGGKAVGVIFRGGVAFPGVGDEAHVVPLADFLCGIGRE